MHRVWKNLARSRHMLCLCSLAPAIPCCCTDKYTIKKLCISGMIRLLYARPARLAGHGDLHPKQAIVQQMLPLLFSGDCAYARA